MKRLLLPLILVILITAVVFVSCSKEDPAPTTGAETATEENTSETSTSSTTKKPTPTFKTAPAETTTEFKGTPVIYPTTSTTAKATTTTAQATTTTTAVTSSKTPTPEVEKPGDQDWDDKDQEVLPLLPLEEDGNANATVIGKLLIDFLG